MQDDQFEATFTMTAAANVMPAELVRVEDAVHDLRRSAVSTLG